MVQLSHKSYRNVRKNNGDVAQMWGVGLRELVGKGARERVSPAVKWVNVRGGWVRRGSVEGRLLR